jgi:cation/acetate symporter
MLANFVISVVIMQFTPQPPENVQEIVESIRIPNETGEASGH